MDWIRGIQRAIDYIENHITDELDYDEIARCAYSSKFHFQRVFSIMCGYSIGEYIRNRRLTLAGNELICTSEKVIDIAFKYGYDSPDSFSKAFTRFHGITPSSARENGSNLKSFSKLSIKLSLEGGNMMKYRIEEKEAMSFVGFKKQFSGDLTARFKQEHNMWITTRDEQELLIGIRSEVATWYDINTNFSDNDYDHYIAVKTDKQAPRGFERINIPKTTYAIFETEPSKYPTRTHEELRKKVISEWLPSSDYILSEGAEITVCHWHKNPNAEKRYIELWIPVEKLKDLKS
ncbi:MAG: AraC family transcriptional regulator [Clostridium sp.]